MKMKQILVLLCLACACLGKPERPEKQNKEKRGISSVTVSAPYSSVRYAPGFPLYGGQYTSSYHGRYFPYGGYGYNFGYNGYNPYFGAGYPSYQPPFFVQQPPVVVQEQPPVIVEPEPPVLVEQEPNPPVYVTPTPSKPVHPPVHPSPPIHHTPPVYQPPAHSPPMRPSPPIHSAPPVYQPPSHYPPMHPSPPTHSPPPVHQPPSHSPPMHSPPIHHSPPVYQPPAHSPPMHSPPIHSSPPVYQPPAHSPPVHSPPIHPSPPVYQPPAHSPPVHEAPARPIVPPIQHRPAGQPPLAIPAHPENTPTVTTSHTPSEVHVTVKNLPGHTTISHPPVQSTPIPSSPPTARPPTHLPEVPVQHHPVGPRENPQPPRIPYQPPTPAYIPQFDTGPQYFPPQEFYVTPAPFTPQYYPYYPQYPVQQPGVTPNTRNIQTVSHPADNHNADLARQRANAAGTKSSNQGYSGIAPHNNGQYLIETTQKTNSNQNTRNYVTIQPNNKNYNNRQRVQNSNNGNNNNFVGEITTTSRPIYNRNDGHYVTVQQNNYRQHHNQPQQQQDTHKTTPHKVNRFEVRRPAIQKQFYDIEEKVIVRPVGSAILELVDDDTSNIMKIPQENQGVPDKNCTTSPNARIIGMKNNQGSNNNSYGSGSGINTQSNSVTLNQRANNNQNGRGDASNRNSGKGIPRVIYADQDMPVYFEDSSELKTPKHILSPFAAQVTQNMTNKDDSTKSDPNSYSKAYLFGRNMINVKDKATTPCPPSKTTDYDDFSDDVEDYNNGGFGVNVSPKGDYGLRSNANANVNNDYVETTTQQNQRNYIEMLSGKNGVAEVQSDTGYLDSKSQNIQQDNKNSGGDANNRVQGRLLSVVPVQEATATEAPTEHSSVRRIVVSRPVETVQIVEVPEYKQSQNQRLISSNNNTNNNMNMNNVENLNNNTQFKSSTVVTPTATRIVYSNQKVETQTVQYQH